MTWPTRIVSGGQTGADRAALDVGLELGIEIGGWVPRDRIAEDGPIPVGYSNLHEAESAEPAMRTSLNVRDADATVIVFHGELVGGSALTAQVADELGRPCLHLDLARQDADEASVALADWLVEHSPAVLNVAGPRATEDPKIHAATKRVLGAALRALHESIGS